MPSYCHCRCHQGSVLAYAVDTRDPVEAVTACQACLNQHVPALTCAEWPIIPKPNPLLLPWVDTYPQADGGEGAE